MTNDKRRLLTEAMGECWHDGIAYIYYNFNKYYTKCHKCCKTDVNNRTFTTPDDFFALWNWAKGQEWWDEFIFISRVNMDDTLEREGKPVVNSFLGLVDKDRFPELVAEFLEGRK